MIDIRDEAHVAAMTISVRRNRPRGIYVPTAEAPLYLNAGWTLLDDCPDALGAAPRDEVLLLPPAEHNQ